MAENKKKTAAGKKKAGASSKYGAEQAHVVNRDTIKKTWKIRPPQEWLALLKEIAPQHNWEMKGHTIIKGRCPYHNDKSPSFILNFDKGMGKCFGAGCEKVVVDIANLVAKLRTCSYLEAVLFIYNRFNLGDAIPADAGDVNEYTQVQDMKKCTAVAMSKILKTVLSKECPPYLNYCKPGVEYLLRVRNLPADILPLLPVGIWAKSIHIKQELPSNLHLQFDDYFKEVNTPGHYGSLCFYYNDSPGSISRFKLRNINQSVATKLQEVPRKLKDKTLLATLFNKGETQYVRDPYLGSGEVGVYGLYNYQAMIGKNDTNAYLTEGEFDVLTPMAEQLKSGSIDFMIFGSGGKGSTDVQFLREYGVRTIWLIGDHPDKQGDEWVKSILLTRNNFLSSAGVTPLQFKVFLWAKDILGTDLDEAVQLNTFAGMQEHLYQERSKNFLNSTAWIYREVDKKLEVIRGKAEHIISLLEGEEDEKATALSNIKDQEKTDMEAAVIEGFRLVHSPPDKQAYVRRFISEHNIDIGAIDAVHSAMYALDTTQGVTDMITSHLQDYFELSYYVQKGTGTSIFAWGKKNEQLIEIPMSERPMPKILAIHTGQEIEQWFDSIFPDNPIYHEGAPADDHSIKASQTRRRNATYLVEKSFEQQLGKMKSYNSLKILSQGIHHSDLSPELRQDGYVYFVNGSAVYRGKFLDAGGDMEWKRLTNAVDNAIVFEDLIKRRNWSRTVGDVTDLYEASVVDLNKVFSDLCIMLNGWVFRNHEPVVELLAAYLMSLPIMRAVADTNIMLLTGEKASGKTTFSAGLMGGSSDKRNACPTILESVYQVDNASLPSLYQYGQGKSHCFVFDEAEQGDKYKSEYSAVIEQFIRLAHSMPHGGVSVARGGRTAEEKVEYFLRFPILMAAINPPRDHTFLSRTFEVRTRWKANHKPAEEHIMDRFTHAQIETLKKHVTIGLIPHIRELTTLRRKLAVDFQKVGQSLARIDNRFLHNLLTPLTVLEHLGRDTKGVYQKIITTNKDRLEAIHSSDPQNDLLNNCLYANRNCWPTTRYMP